LPSRETLRAKSPTTVDPPTPFSVCSVATLRALPKLIEPSATLFILRTKILFIVAMGTPPPLYSLSYVEMLGSVPAFNLLLPQHGLDNDLRTTLSGESPARLSGNGHRRAVGEPPRPEGSPAQTSP